MQKLDADEVVSLEKLLQDMETETILIVNGIIATILLNRLVNIDRLVNKVDKV